LNRDRRSSDEACCVAATSVYRDAAEQDCVLSAIDDTVLASGTDLLIE
jgi:hypothetical protein